MKQVLKKIIILGMIIMCLGFFVACSNGIKEESVSDMIELHTWYFTSGLPNNAIKVNHNDNTVFECTVDKGYLGISMSDNSKSITIGSEETMYWNAFDDEVATWVDLAYVQIILKDEDNIIGYAVIEINQDPEQGLNYHAEILKSVVFPKINGQYQFITEEYINTSIASIIAERE